MILEEVRKNKIKTAFIIAFFFTFVTLCIYFISIYLFDDTLLAVILSLIFSISTSFISYYNSDKLILNINGARKASREEFLQLNVSLEGLCLAAGLPKPELYVMETPALNAFATGRNPEHSVICVTTGLLKNLDKYEMEGVLAHELSHIKNYDILVSTIAIVMVGFINIISDMAFRGSFYRHRDNDNNTNGIVVLIGLVLLILSPLIAGLLNLAISRNREYLADASAVELTRNKEGLINALKKIEALSVPMTNVNKATESLFIADPYKSEHDSIWSTHPSTANRIKKLQNIN
jgi:heat shock protein HtpX